VPKPILPPLSFIKGKAIFMSEGKYSHGIIVEKMKY
jgi:hypothetical protein